MIYPKDFEQKVGFLPLRSLIADKCETPMGRRLVEEMKFSSDRNEVIRRLKGVDEMKYIITSARSLPEDSFYDIYPWINQSKAPGAYLSSEKLFQCARTFESMKNIALFFNHEEDSKRQLKTLKEEFSGMPEFPELVYEINRCIDKGGEVKDNASPELFEIRKSLDSVSKSMHKIMRRVLDESVRQGIIDKDVTPAVRDGHLVIPVSASNKRNLVGILHDSSATGKTFYIEPAEVVEAGNRIKELQLEEKQEIVRILIALTQQMVPYLEEIKLGCQLLASYDFIRAKARFAIETDAQLPVVEKFPELDWFHARHPGLFISLKAQGREVVPLNINLNKENRILVISGPNAGGKSVALKTVGAVQYMLQCGLLPTLYSNSHVGIFNNIFIDIGDEQSMENDLSTYSSHLANMKFFLQNANAKTLVLADEMGSGTEPQIGAALAQSVIQQLGKSGCLGVITTHYQSLKIFADNEEGFVNGAMLYDRQKLRPTFQLLVGQPGSSFALEIARNIGLPTDVIDYAKEIVGADYVEAERFLLDIQRDRKYWKNKRLDIKEKENRLNRLLEEYEAKSDELKQQRSSILKSAKEEAKEILSGANTRIERSIHEIRKSQAEKEKAKAVRKELEEYKKSLENIDDDDNLPDSLKPLRHKSRKKKSLTSKENEKSSSSDFIPGDFVKMDNGGVVGQIISVEGKKAEVAFGNLRMKVEVKNLIHAKKPVSSAKDSIVGYSSSAGNEDSRKRQLNFKQEIDIRGMRADEALQAITYFIDDALQFNAGRVRILHGTGHGILRTLIRDYLKSNPNIRNFHDEDVRFGGAGITVVELE